MRIDGEAVLAEIERWDGVGVVLRHDVPSEAWMIVALHDDTLGPPTGGTRMRTYETLSAAVRDAFRLARGMTEKWAAMDFPFGGGKAVLAVPGPVEGAARRDLLSRYGALLESLSGAFGTGEDLGTTPDDMAFLSTVTEHVVGLAPESGLTDPGPFTARGVFAGIRAVLDALDGRPDPSGRVVAVQGVGDVGEPLARLLAEAGAVLILSDTDAERVRALSRELRCATVPPDDVYAVPCDVFAPCAVGGVLHAGTIARLRCRAVAGSANNQLLDEEDGVRLADRGILYAPDYVINGGGAMVFGLVHRGVRERDALTSHLDGIGDALGEIFRAARERGELPQDAARRRVEAVLERRRA